jgi:hypothetical protein
MAVVLFLHSWVRWIILIVAVAALVKHAIGLMQKSPYDKMARGLMAGFSGLMDLQVLLGIVLLVLIGGPQRMHFEHLGTMIIAAVVAHLPAIWKKKADNVRYRNNVLVIIGALLLIVAAIAPLGNRWFFRF